MTPFVFVLTIVFGIFAGLIAGAIRVKNKKLQIALFITALLFLVACTMFIMAMPHGPD